MYFLKRFEMSILLNTYIFDANIHVVLEWFQTYLDSMRKLQLMTEGELGQIFGNLDDLIPIHEGQ